MVNTVVWRGELTPKSRSMMTAGTLKISFITTARSAKDIREALYRWEDTKRMMYGPEAETGSRDTEGNSVEGEAEDEEHKRDEENEGWKSETEVDVNLEDPSEDEDGGDQLAANTTGGIPVSAC
jgi:hypothetical protein